MGVRKLRPVALDLSSPSELGRDLDLGLRMVEGLIRLGELGAAARLVDHLAETTSATLTPLHPVRQRPVRRVLVGTAAAAVLAVTGLSAAAVLNPAKDARSVRVEPAVRDARTPVQAPPANVTAPSQPQVGSEVQSSTQAPAAAPVAADDAATPGPTAGPVDPGLLPPGTIPGIEPPGNFAPTEPPPVSP